MRTAGCEGTLLRVLGMMPFLDRLEMAAVSGWSRGAVYEAAARLEEAGLAGSISQATDLIPPARRHHLTAAGLGRLAREDGTALETVLRSHPVSAEWRRILLERLDAVAVIYRLAAAVSHHAYPIRFRWYRAGPLDAAIALPGGRTLGIVRQGQTSDRTAFAKRLWRLREGPCPGSILLLLPDEVRLRHARRLVTASPVLSLLALERDAALDGGGAVWRLSSVNAAVDLRAALTRLRPGGVLPAQPRRSRATLPGDIASSGVGTEAPDHLLSVWLKPGEKRALDLLADWPWITLRDLSGLLGVSDRRTAQLTVSLEGFGLVTRVAAAGRRLALTDRGLALLARRDRAAVGAMKRRWSAAPLDAGSLLTWRNVVGGRSRQLLRNAEHTAAVHRFVAALSRQARSLGWEVSQLDPPRRASRYFRHGDRIRSIHPDAFGVLRRGDEAWSFFLEWERRAVRPVTMAARIAPYLRYYATHRPIDDHGARPAVLIVFDDDLAAAHFLRVAREEMHQARAAVPIRVSHGRLLEHVGPLGPAWRSAGDLGDHPGPPSI